MKPLRINWIATYAAANGKPRPPNACGIAADMTRLIAISTIINSTTRGRSGSIQFVAQAV
jgi:hypothetical protein